MCGISGIFHKNSKPVPVSEIEKLTNALIHRGPDAQGIWHNDTRNVALGHRRLSILDLSGAIKYPMNFNNRYWITYNGEIYNFIEIRQTLKKKGYTFITHTDTEVILAAYHEYGVDMLHKFNGMWAFALYDNQKQELLLSRDRYGIKPVYYFQDNNRILFASEVQAIHKLLGKNHPLDDNVIFNIIHGKAHNHGGYTTYLKDVNILPAGHNLLISKNSIQLKKWYQLPKNEVSDTFDGQKETLKELIIDACKIRLRSDVLIGTCLSGGIDSGSITSVIHKYFPTGIYGYSNYTHKGFCASFPDTYLEEKPLAEITAKESNTQLDVVNIVPPTVEKLELAMQQCDGPMHALAFYPIWELYKHIREQGIVVTLDGQGPDEMFAGYSPMRESLMAACELKNPKWFFDIYNTFASRNEHSQFSSKKFAKESLKSFFLKDIPSRIKKKIYNTHVSQNYEFSQERPGFITNALDKSLYNQFFQRPLPSILNQYDRCSMANSVECRMPFMDYRIVEFAFSLPPLAKIGKGFTKRILRESMKGILPEQIRTNKNKIGFNAPTVEWFKNELKEFMSDYIFSDSLLQLEYVDGISIQNDFDSFLNDSNPTFLSTWKFWAPVHFLWWKNKVVNNMPC